MTRVALDAMGGDYAPKQIIVGAVEAVCGLDDVKVLLVGNSDVIKKEVDRFAKNRKAMYQQAIESGRLEIVHAPDQIEMDDVPVKFLA